MFAIWVSVTVLNHKEADELKCIARDMSAGGTQCPEPYANRENSNIQEVATGIQRRGRGETVEPHHYILQGNCEVLGPAIIGEIFKLTGKPKLIMQASYREHKIVRANGKYIGLSIVLCFGSLQLQWW